MSGLVVEWVKPCCIVFTGVHFIHMAVMKSFLERRGAPMGVFAHRNTIMAPYNDLHKLWFLHHSDAKRLLITGQLQNNDSDFIDIAVTGMHSEFMDCHPSMHFTMNMTNQ